MRRSSARRGQVEPLAALAAVTVLGLAFATYAGVLAATAPDPDDRNVASPELTRGLDAVSRGAVVRTDRLDELPTPPSGRQRRVTIRADGRSWTVGPAPPPRADVSSTIIPVRLSHGRVRPGRIRVEVWTP